MLLKIRPGYGRQYILGDYTDVTIIASDQTFSSTSLKDKEVRVTNNSNLELLHKEELVPHICIGTLNYCNFTIKDKYFSLPFVIVNKYLPTYKVVVDAFGTTFRELIEQEIPSSIDVPYINNISYDEVTFEVSVFDECSTQEYFTNKGVLVHNTTGEQIPISKAFEWNLYEITDETVMINSDYTLMSFEQVRELNTPKLQAGWEEYTFDKSHVTNHRGWLNLVVNGKVWDEESDTEDLKLIESGRLGSGGGRHAVTRFKLYVRQNADIEILDDKEVSNFTPSYTTETKEVDSPFASLKGLFKS
jgi:hypothetical protein